MHEQTLEPWTHDHVFGQDVTRPGERRTLIVVAITAAMMFIEIAVGLTSESMALLADGMHMASHASALTISALAYYYTRRHAGDKRFNFGTGKINSLTGFASAVMLVGFALIMAWESFGRLAKPVPIGFNQAILVAVMGLAVNAVCLLILKGHDHDHDHEHEGHEDDEADHHHTHGRDHNLWSAYIHVFADAMTSVFAILALLAGKYYGLVWMDPLMGVVGAILVAHWCWGLIRSSGHVLLDMEAPASVRSAIMSAVEGVEGNRVSDLHIWNVGPGIYAAEIGIVASQPLTPDAYRSMLPEDLGLVHVTIETQRCDSRPVARAA